MGPPAMGDISRMDFPTASPTKTDVWPVFLAWIVTFWVIIFICLGVGFGPKGIIGGSLAAAFQSYMYGGFTPAGGIFATLTSMAMLGVLIPPLVVVAVVVSCLVAAIVWLSGTGQ
ncbi:hypothetical protein B0T18DRAFT_163200 [Schizothecium vesticola]|uniref:Uncharacterized protein n=1 Tax=Schizothecium vesticola TaxID=314040 RepID=A0AA40EWX7_9PEZI|nr:hypothetical protein B0T18DRAFT_163200 [Schizothecium vesticola]